MIIIRLFPKAYPFTRQEMDRLTAKDYLLFNLWGVKMIDIKKLDKIINNTLKALEEGKKQLYDIAENTREEYERTCRELEEAKEEVSNIIKRVDELEKQEKKARIWLMEVHRNFTKFTETDVKAAYKEAQRLQLLLNDWRHREVMARFKRDQLERRVKQLKETLRKAENLMSHLGVVFNYLASDLQSASKKISELEQLHQMGVNIIRAQEEERKRVAREIHDGPAQLLANIVMRAEFCLKLLEVEPGRVKEELKGLQELVRQSLHDVRKIIFDLRPMVLDDLGLIAALKRYLSDYKDQHKIEIELVCLGPNKRMPVTTEVAVFRIIQECLNNIQKHAGAKHATIKVEMLKDKINVTVRDDEQGFEVENAGNNEGMEGYGLVNMRERAGLLNGKIDIQSTPGRGTTVYLSVPVTEWFDNPPREE